MSTTAVFAELLVAGTGALVWALTFGLAFASKSWPSPAQLQLLKEWQSPITAVAIALAYVVGVVIDRVADSMLDPIDQWYRNRILGEGYPVADTRLRIAQAGQHLTEYLGYIRTRMRVARSAAFNAAVLTIALATLLRFREDKGGLAISATLLIGTVVTLICIFAWLRISRTFYKRIRNARTILVDEEGA